jgi:hyaluronan synthase
VKTGRELTEEPSPWFSQAATPTRFIPPELPRPRGAADERTEHKESRRDLAPGASRSQPHAGGSRGRHRGNSGSGDTPDVAPGEGRVGSLGQYSACRSRVKVAAVTAILTAALAAWGVHHVFSAETILAGRAAPLTEIYALTFIVMAWQVLLSLFDRPRKVTDAQLARLDRLNLVVAIPCYNEDPSLLEYCINSLLRQTRRPDHIYVVDDGSDKADYTAVRNQFEHRAWRAGVRATWTRTPNAGKRHAHAVAVRGTPDADVYVTIDSDGILDKRALAELLKPFADPRVQSSAGVVLAANNRVNLLARLTDLCYVTAQFTARSSLSVMGSVMVNSGVLAAYRAPVIRDNLTAYLNETFFGRKVNFSDDSMLTLFAFLRGKTVHQPTAFVFTAMPCRLNHHARQYLRWMRGSFIRAWWRFRYLPIRSYAYWWHLLSWIFAVISLGVFADIYVDDSLEGQFKPTYLIVPVVLSYAVSLRYLTIRRRDEPFRSQLLTWLLAPVSVAWSFTVLRAWRWYGALTCWKTGWGTRRDIEVSLEETCSEE